MKRTRFLIGAVGVVALVGIQWVPVPRSNPPVEADIDTPVAVKAVLRRACYDCHPRGTE